MTRPPGFCNPLGRNPFACPLNADGIPRFTEAELEAALRRYCLLTGIPLPKGKARAKAIPKPAGGNVTQGMRDSYLAGQTNAFGNGE